MARPRAVPAVSSAKASELVSRGASRASATPAEDRRCIFKSWSPILPRPRSSRGKPEAVPLGVLGFRPLTESAFILAPAEVVMPSEKEVPATASVGDRTRTVNTEDRSATADHRIGPYRIL